MVALSFVVVAKSKSLATPEGSNASPPPDEKTQSLLVESIEPPGAVFTPPDSVNIGNCSVSRPEFFVL
jgi:hypothetical protein